MKRRFRIILIPLLLPVLLLAWLIATESGLNWSYQQARAYLPVDLQLQTLHGRLLGPITLSQLSYEQDGTRLAAERVVFNWNPLALLTASISINQLHIQSLDITLPPKDPQTPSQQQLKLPEIRLPWHTILKDLQINGVSFSQGEQHISLQKIALHASTLLSKVDIEALQLVTQDISVDVRGTLWTSKQYRHDLQLQWQAALPSSAVMRGDGKLTGDIHATHLQQQTHGPAELSIQADINNLLEQIGWQAKIEASAFHTAQLVTDGPPLTGRLSVQASGNLDTLTATGNLQGIYAENDSINAEFTLQKLADNSVQIKQLQLRSAASDTELSAHGEWTPDEQSGRVKLALNWKNLRWPLQTGAWFSSANGHATIDGSLSDYQLDITTDRPWAEAPPSTWHAIATGNLLGMKFAPLQIHTLDGEVNVNGQLNWSPQLNWQANVRARNINPASLLPQWPGKLSAKFTSNGRTENGELIVDTEITQLQGTLRNYAVSLQSQLSWKNHGFDISQLEFHSGASRLSARGRAGDTLKLEWSIDTPNLAELYPQAKGEFAASGTLAGKLDAPFLSGTFKGNALSLDDYAIGSIDAKVAIDLEHWQQIDIQLKAQSLKYKDYVLQSLNVSADTKELHAQLMADALIANIALKGTIDNTGWHGKIQQAELISPRYDNWQLKNPVALSIAQDTLQLESLCLHSSQLAHVCATLSRQHSNWLAQLDMSQLPLKLLDPWLPPDLQLEGLSTARAELQLTDKLLGNLSIELLPGALSYPLLEGERNRWEYRGGFITATQNLQGLKTEANIDMSNGDKLSVSVELPEAMLLNIDPEQQRLHAKAQLTAHDLGVIESLMPEVQDLKGEITLNVTADGTLAQPRLSGQAHIRDGAFRVPRLGLSINPVTLSLKSEGADKVRLQINARSAEGEISIQGVTSLDKAAGWPTQVTIKGKNFEVAHIPEARVLVSPDLQITAKHNLINISGNIHIPNAKLQPKDISTAVRISDDVIIIGGEQPAQQKWLVETKVRITLGDRVSFYGFGFEGRLGGSLLIEDTPGQLTRATGEITIPEGTYRAYGQRLVIEHGRLIYTGIPLANPGLDIRAVRHVNHITAGLKVIGSLNQPQIELFSTPAMGQTDSLSYLVLGRPLETSTGEDGAMLAKAALAFGLSGGDRLARLLGDRFGLDEMRIESNDTGDQASLVVGRYLSPKIYVSYGVGLIEAINTFTVRYNISENWQLKAESGEAQGADIFYTIER